MPPSRTDADTGAAGIGLSFFSDNTRLLDTISPIDLGGEAFARRLDLVRTVREPLGLVLSGGSARAFAHIGVLKALEEEGIRPDFIVANSMGAIVGMMYAAGLSPDSIEALVSGVSIGNLIDPVLPFAGGFVNADRFAAFVRSIVGDVDIADLPIPILIIFEDLESRRQVRAMKGNFADVMAASFALPGIFEPARLGGYTLIDGGITNLVPTSAARDYSRAVLVSATMYDKSMSFSNPFTVINRAIDIGKTRSAIRELVDLKPVIIRNDVENISYMEFSRPRGIIARGYMSARAAMPEIRTIAGRSVPVPALVEKNARYAPLVEKAIDDFVKGNEPPNLPKTLVVPVFKVADDLAGEGAFDLGRRYIGFRALRRNGAITTGAGLDFSLGDDPSHAWGLVLLASARPTGGFFAQVQGRLSGPWRSISSGIPLEVRAIDIAGRTGFVFGGGHILGSAFAGAEFGANFLPSDRKWRMFSGISARTHRLRPIAADASLGWFLDSADNAGPEWKARISSRTSADAGLRLRTAGRYSVFGPGTFLGEADAYRGPLPMPAKTAKAWLAGNVEAVWRARILDFDAGEMIVGQNIEFAPFLDIAWGFPPSGTPLPIPEMAAGLSASASISLLGVTPFDFSLSLARSLSGEAWRISFNTGKLFR